MKRMRDIKMKIGLIKGSRYWNTQYWRYMWYRGSVNGKHLFEDVAGERFLLSDDTVSRTITEHSWRETQSKGDKVYG